MSDKSRDSSKDFDTLSAAGNARLGPPASGRTAQAERCGPGIGDQRARTTHLRVQDVRQVGGMRSRTSTPSGGNSEPTRDLVGRHDDVGRRPKRSKIYAYKMSDKSETRARTSTLLAGQRVPLRHLVGRDHDVGRLGGRADAYKMSDKGQGRGQPTSAPWYRATRAPTASGRDGTTMWVADRDDSKLDAYKMSDQVQGLERGLRRPRLSAAGNQNPRGIWSDATTMWVADRDDASCTRTRCPTSPGTRRRMSLHTDNSNPFGIWSDDDTIWVAATSTTASSTRTADRSAERQPQQEAQASQREYVGPRRRLRQPDRLAAGRGKPTCAGSSAARPLQHLVPGDRLGCEKDRWPQPALAVVPDPGKCGLIELPAAIREQLDKPLVGETALAAYVSVRREISNQNVREAKIEEGFAPPDRCCRSSSG